MGRWQDNVLTDQHKDKIHSNFKKYTKYTAVIKIAISIIKSKFIWEECGPGGCAREHRNLLKLNESALCLHANVKQSGYCGRVVFTAGLFKWHEYAQF